MFTKTALTLALTGLIAGILPCAAEASQGEEAPVSEISRQKSTEKFQQAQDMRYGAALYHYFQGNTFDALSTLMVSDLRGGISYHADNAELIRGGISLAFGLERQAADLFEQQLQKAPDPENQQRIERFREIAWLKLAELNYRHQNWDTAALQLEKSGAIHQTTLTLNLAIRNGDLSQAAQLLRLADLTVAERVLGHNNLAAAFARDEYFPAAAEEYRRAAELVDKVTLDKDLAGDLREELYILRDKARIGAGYALTLQGDYTAAAEEFRRVRLDTPWSPDALLGLGWASVNGAAHTQAVDALGYLIRENPLLPQVQEALLALPYTYEALDRPKLALRSYQSAEQQYQRALDDLNRLAGAAGQLQFAEIDGDEHIDLQRYGWLEDAETPALIRMNQHYLLQMMQSDRLQLQLSELRDLQQLRRVLDRWQQRLPEFHTLIEEREQRRVAIVREHDSAQYDQQVQIAEQQLGQLQASLARVEADKDGLAMFADSDNANAEYLEMLREAETRYQKLSAAGKTSNYQQQTLARARGILQWYAAEEYHQNLWRKRKALDTLEEQLIDAARNQRKVARISAEAPQLNLLAGSVEDAGLRINQQRSAIDRASAVIEHQIRSDLQSALSEARVRVEQYMAHTRLAIARIQDAAMQGHYDPPEAPAQETTLDVTGDPEAAQATDPVADLDQGEPEGAPTDALAEESPSDPSQDLAPPAQTAEQGEPES
ncbi:hypothetical protein HXX02_06020 [Microbulbifer elongatus]|uniref:Tetratricopeptide repeat protein n=1 Tax=Microbulbifer elongatus TaxID=86173 RepID=A0ABT1NYT1_9GAMM|nr:hypothetical protein [Microbulbifer elongatus]MCQ3828993.1 hypothetical protein [Microbulbifer elongatus]